MEFVQLQINHKQVINLHEKFEQQEISKSGNDILEQEQAKTSNVEDILLHFKQ
jgi:hypothetical protein